MCSAYEALINLTYDPKMNILLMEKEGQPRNVIYFKWTLSGTVFSMWYTWTMQ